jgi:hypothetical protein
MKWLSFSYLMMICVSLRSSMCSTSWINFRKYFNPAELYFVIETPEYAAEVFYAVNLMNKIAIIWVTYDPELDPYLKLYLEYVLELTKELDCVHLIIRNSINDADMLPQVIEMIPDKSVLLIIEDADLRLNICSLYSSLLLLSRESPILFHLNHETPWIDSTMGISATGELCSSFQLDDIYRHYKYVFRNYFSHLYQSSSDYVPLLSKEGRTLQKFRQENPLLRSSERENWCVFSGRVKYDHQREVRSIFHAERDHFIDLISQSSSESEREERSCRAYYNSDGHDGHQHSFVEYMSVLSQSVFTPCPAGNSPETFRHYEV